MNKSLEWYLLITDLKILNKYPKVNKSDELGNTNNKNDQFFFSF